MRVRLHNVAHVRSGDKGDTACISVTAYSDALYPLLKEQLIAFEEKSRMVEGREKTLQDALMTAQKFAEENKEIFLKHGGEHFTFIPCLNDSDGGIRVLLHVIERELKGWVSPR